MQELEEHPAPVLTVTHTVLVPDELPQFTWVADPAVPTKTGVDILPPGALQE